MIRLAIDCPVHGLRFPARADLRRQKADDGPWRCPECNRPSPAVEIPAGLEVVCGWCREALPERPVYDDEMVAYFCDPLCQILYRESVKGSLRDQMTNEVDDG